MRRHIPSASRGVSKSGVSRAGPRQRVWREKFRDVEEELRTVLARATQLREQLLTAVEEDSDSYDEVSKAYKLPRDTDEQKAQRTAEIQKALRHATEVPLKPGNNVVSVFAREDDELQTRRTLLVYRRGDNAVAERRADVGQ